MSAGSPAGGIGESLGSIMPVLQMSKGAYDMLGAVRRGRISPALGAAMNIYSGYQGMSKPPEKVGAPTTAEPTTQNKIGMSRDEFMSLDPELRQRMLQQILGR